jgi:hypothetical protein
MQQTLQDLGCKALFLKNKHTRKSRLWYRGLQAVKYVCTGKPKRAKHLLRVYFNFRKAQKKMPIAASYAGMDAVVYGSDTIWDIEPGCFLDDRKRFFGMDFDGRKIAYAASVGSATTESLFRHKDICSAVTQFDAIAVRDQSTEAFVKACCGPNQKIEFVVDPTMLLPVETYEAMAPAIDRSGYILFYFFGAIPESIKKQVRAFAERTGREIVVFGEDMGWADHYVSNDPFLMLSYYQNADFVITNTFHGNVFSLIFNKQFVSFGKEKQKVRDLLERFGLSDRLAELDADLSTLLEMKIDHSNTNDKLEKLRTRSRQFLHDAIFHK